jgi:transcriptional regulator with XRE-family HTH domain
MPRPRPDRQSVDEAFGHVVRGLRTEQGLSQEALGHATDSGRTYVSELERGIKGPSLKMVFRLAAALDVNPSELVRLVERSLSRPRPKR